MPVFLLTYSLMFFFFFVVILILILFVYPSLNSNALACPYSLSLAVSSWVKTFRRIWVELWPCIQSYLGLQLILSKLLSQEHIHSFTSYLFLGRQQRAGTIKEVVFKRLAHVAFVP